MREMFDQGVPVDIITLADFLRKKQWRESVGEEPYLAEIAESIATSANIAYYVRQLREKARLRQLIETCAEAASDAYKADASPTAILDKLNTSIGQLEIAREGYDLSKWTLSRFSGEPEPDKFLSATSYPKGWRARSQRRREREKHPRARSLPTGGNRRDLSHPVA